MTLHYINLDPQFNYFLIEIQNNNVQQDDLFQVDMG